MSVLMQPKPHITQPPRIRTALFSLNHLLLIMPRPGLRNSFQKLLFPKEKLIIGLESTGIYSENLICFLFDSGYKLAVINPIQTAALRKTNIRKTKNDKVDTLLIIKSLMAKSYRLYTEHDAHSLKPKFLCRFRQNLKNPRQDSKFSFRDMSICFLTFHSRFPLRKCKSAD